MKKEFIPYEQALELKELGFDEPCLDCYNHKGNLWGMRLDQQSTVDNACLAPIYQQAFRWIREKYGYNCFITSSTIDGKWYYFRENLNNRKDDSEPELTPKFETYEEAELACLKTLIELIKK